MIQLVGKHLLGLEIFGFLLCAMRAKQYFLANFSHWGVMMGDETV